MKSLNYRLSLATIETRRSPDKPILDEKRDIKVFIFIAIGSAYYDLSSKSLVSFSIP